MPFSDRKWTESQWQAMLNQLVEESFCNWQEITALVLGHLNPPQVGTSMASSAGFKRKYGKGNVMPIVMTWIYEQDGLCAQCKTRLELQADHKKPKEEFRDPLDADTIENMQLLCRRCNVVRRPSHVLGGKTFLTTEAALMWILLVYRPRTRKDYIALCRLYGLVMADIRMNEGWAMAEWLSRSGQYEKDSDAIPCDVIQCADGAITRMWKKDRIEADFSIIKRTVMPDRHIVIVATDQSPESGQWVVMCYRRPIREIPFSHYLLSQGMPPQALAFQYVPPDRKNKDAVVEQSTIPLPPAGMTTLAVKISDPDGDVAIAVHAKNGDEIVRGSISARSARKKLCQTEDGGSLRVALA